MKNRTALVMIAACCAALAVGCQSESKDKKAAADTPAPQQASMGAMNTKCPVMPAHAAGTKTVVDYNGQKVAFCCAGCVPKWNAMSDADKAAALAKAK